MTRIKNILFLFTLLIGLVLVSCGKFEPLTPNNEFGVDNSHKAGVNDPNEDEDEEGNGSVNDADEDEDEENKGGKPDNINDEDEDEDEANATTRRL